MRKIDQQIKDLYGHLDNTEINGYNTPEDRNIAKMVIGKFFSKYPNNIKKEIKDDCILELWAKRSQFRADKGASYSTWGFAVCRNAMLNKYANKIIMDLNCGSLDAVISIDESGKETTALDLCADKKSTVDLEKLDKQKAIQTAKSEFENENVQKIIDLTLQGLPPREIIRIVGVCRQYVARIKKEYQDRLQKVS